MPPGYRFREPLVIALFDDESQSLIEHLARLHALQSTGGNAPLIAL